MEEKILLKTERSRSLIWFVAAFLAIITFFVVLDVTAPIYRSIKLALKPSCVYALCAFLLGCVIGFIFMRAKVTITDKRVLLNATFGQRVDLPLDSISAIRTGKFLKRLSVSSPSGRITLLGIKNLEESYNVISKLLIERQNNAK